MAKPKQDHMVLMHDPNATSDDGWNEDSEVVVYHDGNQMFMSKRQANALVKEMSAMYSRCKYRAVALPQ
ncbi:hypothetical protein F5_00011 [Xanthomonas phage F5]|uniref:Uncharacterized protein n=1 Tax=Xanthomonas phage F5 TaxID=3003369 RepID=A0AAE9VMT9_9CAUD|nr:hypothetical protein F5_00011 [Xanthomonas phage F5]